ncbi:alpha/beta-hydrolase [Delitschia confertaspora ATCC 74209]|uniref:Kynurenine formamidase n=1 Tax=Delitschia confertaspora ATCC 74209 TaxID=1513339 RepID=A0A9P4JIR1_9PLEO|nr:alpha/beta-hydrolase [Delitschia confertaspora ATCC 74209]
MASSYPKYIPSIHYTDEATKLQTLDIWLPRPLSESSPGQTVWIVYIHGGAWRDPAQTSQCILPTLKHLFPSSNHSGSKSLDHIAGIASINYRLSPYESHPTDPSSTDDASRNVRHPEHLRDVAKAMEWLRVNYRVGQRFKYFYDFDKDMAAMRAEEDSKSYGWIGIGHSCGATLWLQYISKIPFLIGCTPILGLRTLILLEGIYDFPGLLEYHSPPQCPPEVAKIYKDFIGGTFGLDPAYWRLPSPAHAPYGFGEESMGESMVLCHSDEDELVEWGQVESLVRRLRDCEWRVRGSEWDGVEVDEGLQGDLERGEGDSRRGHPRREMFIKKLKGEHDWIWEEGTQIAKLIEEAVERVFRG